MKNNTSQAKTLLEQAIRSMPDDFSLGEARNLMRAALASIEKVESRRTSRQMSQDMLANALEARRLAGMPTTQSMTSNEAKMAVLTLDKMIAKEKRTLEELAQKPNTGSNDEHTQVQTLYS